MSAAVATCVVVVSFNSRNEIEDALGPLLNRPGIHIVVVDNASTDDTCEVVTNMQRKYRNIRLIVSPDNVGFARGVNIGIHQAPNMDVLLLNPDARINESDIATLRKVANTPGVGLAAPLVHGDSRQSVISAGRQPRIWPLFTHYFGLSRIFPNSKFFAGRHLFFKYHSNRTHSVEWTSGCCLYIPRKTLDSVGLLSERWFMYGEDLDYCKRVTGSGSTILLTPSANAYHSVGASINAGTTRTINTMWATNTYDYYLTSFQAGRLAGLLWRVIFSTGLLSRVAVTVLRTRSFTLPDRDRRFVAYAKAVW